MNEFNKYLLSSYYGHGTILGIQDLLLWLKGQSLAHLRHKF